MLPQKAEAGGEVFGMENHVLVYLLGREKGEACDFVGVGGEGAWVDGAVKPDKLLIGFGAGREVVGAGEGKAGGGGDADLFGDFAVHGGVVLFSCVDMATDAGGPATGFAIFVDRATLEEEATIGVVEPEVNRAMEQALGVNLGAKGGADDSVLLIDEVKLFVRTVHRVGAMRQDRVLRLVG